MSDFLHNLRNQSKDRRYDRNRKNYGGNQYNQSDRRNNSAHGRRKPEPNALEQLANLVVESRPAIESFLKEMGQSYKRLADAGERRAKAQELQAEAMQTIAAHLQTTGRLPSNPDAEAEALNPEAAPPDAPIETTEVISAPEPPLPDHDRVKEIIKTKRAEGTTYSQIALYLEEQSIPTISGRGKWRAQTVSKLCQ